jgi:hypothetical protein
VQIIKLSTGNFTAISCHCSNPLPFQFPSLPSSELFYRYFINYSAYRISGFLDFFQRPMFWGVETRRFGNWICFLPQGKGGEDTYYTNHWVIEISSF